MSTDNCYFTKRSIWLRLWIKRQAMLCLTRLRRS
jgi:hypothetical protein